MKNDFPENLRYYKNISHTLEINEELIMSEGRVLIPQKLRKETLTMLHEMHIGIVKSKQLARKYFFWPGINKDIENYAAKCIKCKEINADRQKKAYIP